jgi:hypothetical protein
LPWMDLASMALLGQRNALPFTRGAERTGMIR